MAADRARAGPVERPGAAERCRGASTSGPRRSWPWSTDLLGCVLVSRRGGRLTAGRIVETEAYLGPEDAASHAAFRPASRHLFYGPGGIAYVYRIYGIHACLNAIANPRGTPGCVLIRALEPLAGRVVMARRRRRPELARGPHRPRALAALTGGPARLTEALGLTVSDSGRDLRRGPLTIHAGLGPPARAVARGTRIGITRTPGSVFATGSRPARSCRRAPPRHRGAERRSRDRGPAVSGPASTARRGRMADELSDAGLRAGQRPASTAVRKVQDGPVERFRLLEVDRVARPWG